MSLLDKLKSSAKTEAPKSSKSKTPQVVMDKDFFKSLNLGFDKEITDSLIVQSEQDLKEISGIDETIKSLEGKKAMISSRLNMFSQKHYLNLFNKSKTRPENFRIVSNDLKASCLYQVQSKYSKENIALLEEINADMIETTPTITVNMELFIKYEKEISKFLATAKTISDEEKDKFFTYSEVKTVKSDTLDILATLATKDKSITDLFELLKPVNFVSKFAKAE